MNNFSVKKRKPIKKLSKNETEFLERAISAGIDVEAMPEFVNTWDEWIAGPNGVMIGNKDYVPPDYKNRWREL